MAFSLNSLEDIMVDVLIVGAGPAGYMAAVTLARYGPAGGAYPNRSRRR